MDCEGCTDRLIDLLYGELEDADADATRAHLAACETCAAAFARVTKGRELGTFLLVEEPPPAVRSAVMRAARERAAGRAPVRSDPVVQSVRATETREREQDDESAGLWASLARWLGGIAMGPQVAMAMMLLLMVGIGLWHLPDWRGKDPTGIHAIDDPAAGDEVGPSRGAISEPGALGESAGAARLAPRLDEAAWVDGRESEGARPSPTSSGASQRASTAPAPARDHAPSRTDHGARAAVPRRARSGPELPSPSSEAPPVRPGVVSEIADSEAADLHAEVADLHAEVALPPAAPPTAAFAGRSPSRDLGPRESAPQAAASGMEPPVRSAAVRAPEQVEARAPELLPPALHQLAQNQAAANQCEQAIRSFERLLAEFPTYPRASEARLQLAECYRRTGQVTRARQVLQAASRDPRTSMSARRELVRLESAERAADRQTEPARTPDAPAVAGSAAQSDDEPGR